VAFRTAPASGMLWRVIHRNITGGIMGPYVGFDFYQLDDQLSDEEKLVRQSVREFVEEKFLPIIEEHY
jgi:hypothetical protein